MSGIEAAGAILGIIQIANSSIQLLRAINNVDDPKVELIYSKLMTQRSVVKNWIVRFRAESANGGLNVPPESVADVKEILQKMTIFWDRAEAKMAKIYRGPSGKMTPRVLAHRFYFECGGFQELKELTDALDAMNEALKFIALPPPYHDPNGTSWQTPRYEGPNVEAHDINSIAEAGRNDPAAISTTSEESIASRVSLSKLYAMCVEMLDVLLAEQSDIPGLESLPRRLKQWGDGLFQGPTGLDLLLEHGSGEELLHAAILRSFIYIAIIEESLLRIIDEPGESVDEHRQRLKKHRTNLTAMLGSEPLSELSLEIWADLQRFSTPSVSVGPGGETRQILGDDICHDVPGIVPERTQLGKMSNSTQHLRSDSVLVDDGSIRGLESLMEAIHGIEGGSSLSLVEEDRQTNISDDDDNSHTESDMVTQLSEVIDMLFDLSPAIRALRRACFLMLEENETGQSADPPTLFPTKTPIPQNTDSLGPDISERKLAKGIENSLGLASALETVLKNDEKWARQNGQKIILYAPILQKERERLQEFERSKPKIKDPVVLKGLLSTISGLEQALGDTLQDVEVKEKPGRNLGARPHVDVKLSGRETDKKLAEALDIFRESNTALWSR